MQSTLDAFLKLTFGTPDEARAAAARINAIHDVVSGALQAPVGPFPAGTSYSANDPELLVNVNRLEDNLQNFIAPSQIAAGLAATLGGLGLLLATIGIYGTVSYLVGRRTTGKLVLDPRR